MLKPINYSEFMNYIMAKYHIDIDIDARKANEYGIEVDNEILNTAYNLEKKDDLYTFAQFYIDSLATYYRELGNSEEDVQDFINKLTNKVEENKNVKGI